MESNNMQSDKSDPFLEESNLNIMQSEKSDPFLEESNLSPMTSMRSTALQAMASVRKLGFSDEYQTYESTSVSLILSLLAVLSYVLVGTITFASWMEDWTVIDAMYFTSVTFTTVGYGDLYPVTTAQRIWGTVFVFLGITILGGIALSIIFDRVISMYDAISKDMKSETYKYYLNIFQDEDATTSETMIARELAKVIFKTVPLLILLFLPALLIGYFEGWTFLESLYFYSITATTVGYGDISPQTQISRVIATIYLPFSVMIMAWILGQFSGVIIKQKAQASEKEFLNRQLTFQDLRAMDTGSDGSVSYSEFLTFMLETMGKVEKEDLKQIKDLYEKLDADHNNSLTIDDLERKVYGQSANTGAVAV